MANWIGFTIAFVLLGIVPIWFMNFTGGIGVGTRIFLTLGVGVATYFAVESGGFKRGFISR